MTSIQIKHLSYTYPSQAEAIFSDLSLDLDSSWKLALVGRNGRGKTTFLRLLAGQLGDRRAVKSPLTFTYYPRFLPKDEAAYFSLMDEAGFELWRLEKEMNRLNLEPELLYQPFGLLSGGEQSKLLLALAFSQDGVFPLLDEPTNHLDSASRREVAEYLKKSKTGYIVVSHDRTFLEEVSDHVLALENGEIHLYQDDFAGYQVTKKQRDQTNQEKDQQLRREIKSLEKSRKQLAANAQKAESSIHAKGKIKPDRRAELSDKGFLSKRAAKVMKRSKNVARRQEKEEAAKQGLLSNIEEAPALNLNFKPNYHQTIFTGRDLSLEIAGRTLFKGLNMELSSRGIVALTGPNGSGKTSFFSWLLGKEDLACQGDWDLQTGLKISYLPQDLSSYRGRLEAFAKEHDLNYENFLNQLKKLGLEREAFKQKIEEMSQGQKKRVALAKSLTEEASLYLWDEPANYLDLFNQDQLIDLLKKERPAMLLVDHDQAFIDAVAEQKVSLQAVL
ncbi:ribosomal protection-like ABC-F family protein [Lactobacillus sp.]|uniref:ribosomal protection-like ABC-F family protein n=1 Tax=Lactobacillus sp. TaxID=1591 RepID=UPI003F0FC0BC